MGKEYNILKNIITVLLGLLILGLAAVTTSAVPIEHVCDYAGPPPGCRYVNGPDYNSTTLCGKVLSCPTPIPTSPDPTGVTLDSKNITMPTSTVPIQHIPTPPEPKNIVPGLDFTLGISILSVAYLFGKKRR